MPAVRSDPSAGTMRISFRRYPALGGPARHTLLAIEGGPGYPTVGSAGYYLAMLGPARRTTALVLVDQRGTGESELIDCAPLQDFPYAPFAPVALRPYRLAVGRCGELSGAAATPTARAPRSTTWSPCSTRSASRASTCTATRTARSPRRRSRCGIRARALAGARRHLSARLRPLGARRAGRPAPRAAHDLPALADVPLARARPARARGDARPQPARAPPRRLVARPAAGCPCSVRLDDRGLAGVLSEADGDLAIYRDLPAAVEAFDRGDRAPLARLAAEAFAGGANGPAQYYSAGLDAAVECHDYPQLFDRSGLAGRAARAARRGPAPAARGRLRAVRQRDVVRRRPRELRLVRELAAAGARARSRTPAAARRTRPLPTLVLDGDLDQRTSLIGARRVASQFPHSTLVPVPNTGHVTALVDWPGCMAGIVRRFVATRRATDTACAARRRRCTSSRRSRARRAARPRRRPPPATRRGSPTGAGRGAPPRPWPTRSRATRCSRDAGRRPCAAGASPSCAALYLTSHPVTLRLRRASLLPRRRRLREGRLAPHERPGARDDRLPRGARAADLVARDARPRAHAGHVRRRPRAARAAADAGGAVDRRRAPSSPPTTSCAASCRRCPPSVRAERDGPLVRTVGWPRGGIVEYRDLGGSRGRGARRADRAAGARLRRARRVVRVEAPRPRPARRPARSPARGGLRARRSRRRVLAAHRGRDRRRGPALPPGVALRSRRRRGGLRPHRGAWRRASGAPTTPGCGEMLAAPAGVRSRVADGRTSPRPPARWCRRPGCASAAASFATLHGGAHAARVARSRHLPRARRRARPPGARARLRPASRSTPPTAAGRSSSASASRRSPRRRRTSGRRRTMLAVPHDGARTGRADRDARGPRRLHRAAPARARGTPRGLGQQRPARRSSTGSPAGRTTWPATSRTRGSTRTSCRSGGSSG